MICADEAAPDIASFGHHRFGRRPALDIKMSSNSADTRNRRRGFTLVEVLVAIAVLGLVTAMLALAFQHSQAVVTRVVTARENRQDVLQLQQNLHTWLASSHPFDPDRGNAGQILPLHGSSEEVTFTAPLDVTNGQNDLYRVHIYVKPIDKVLVADVAPDRNVLDAPPSTTQLLLMDDIETLKISYFDGAPANAWLNDWAGRTDLPRAVKIAVDFPSGDPRHWGDLVTYVRVGGREYCEFDPVVRRCR